jgi:hypothetical protein
MVILHNLMSDELIENSALHVRKKAFGSVYPHFSIAIDKQNLY